MNIMLKVYDASEGDEIDAEEGRLVSLGYTVKRWYADEGFDSVSYLDIPPAQHSYDDAVVLMATSRTTSTP